MYTKTLRKIISWQFLAVIAISLTVSALGPLILSASVAADTPKPAAGQATWFYNPEKCAQGSDQAQAALAYTYNDGSNRTIIMHCEFITKTSNQDNMRLTGPSLCGGNPAPEILVGRDANHQNAAPLATAKQGSITLNGSLSPNGICSAGSVTVNVTLTNTYTNGSTPPPPQTVGTATWTTPYVADQAELKANYIFDFGGGVKYTSPKDEVFDQTNLSPDGILTLTSSTLAAPGTSCNGDSISYGPDATSQSATVTISLWGYEGGSDLHCYQRTGALSITNGSFKDIGGSLDTSGGTSTFSGGKCPIKGDGDWLFCMIADVTSGATEWLSKALQTMLYTPVDQIFGKKEMKTAFDSFRNIGVSLLVIVGLFMVLSQAAGLEIFAAYTVRKALPRLVIAMIGISLAWPILQFVVTFFNDIGVWAAQLILNSVGIQGAGAPLEAYNFQSGATVTVAIIGLLVFSTGIAMSLLGTLLLALLVGFMVLAIRQLVILVAILMAPLAIAASILPSTQKIWHFWRESLLTALAMFPIIMAFLGAGKAMSVIAGSVAEGTTDAGRSFTWKLLSIICLIVPLFMMPFAFRIAGGLVGTAHSLLTGSKLGKGAFGRLSEYRSKKAAERWEDTKGGRLLRPGSFLGKVPGVDKAADFASNWASTGALFASGHISRGRRNAYRANAEAAHAMEVGGKDVDFSPARGNEDYYLAGLRGYRYKTGRKIRNAAGEEVDEYATTDGTEAGARRYYEAKGYTGASLRNAVGQTTMMKRKLGQHGFEIAAAMYTPGSGTAFAEGGVEEMDKVIANAARGDRALAAQILNVARQNASQAGRIDLSGAGFAMHLNEIANVMAGGQANGARLMQEAFMSTDAVTLSRARKNGLTLIMNAVGDEIKVLSKKEPMDINIERQVQGIETQLKDPTITGTIRANLQAQLNGIRKNYATEEEQRSLGRLKEGLEKLRYQALQYAAPERNIPIFEAMNRTSAGREEVNVRVRQDGPQRVDARGNTIPREMNEQTTYGSNEQNPPDNPYRARVLGPDDPNFPQTPAAPTTTPGAS